jgi:hypothetical protein
MILLQVHSIPSPGLPTGQGLRSTPPPRLAIRQWLRRLQKRRGPPNHLNLPPCRHHELCAGPRPFSRTGGWRTTISGPVVEAPGETWSEPMAPWSTIAAAYPADHRLPAFPLIISENHHMEICANRILKRPRRRPPSPRRGFDQSTRKRLAI